MKKNADINSESTRNQRGKKKPEWCEGNQNISYHINLQAFQFLSFLLNIVKTLPSRLVLTTDLRSTLVPTFLLLTVVMFFAKKLGISEGQVVRVLDS